MPDLDPIINKERLQIVVKESKDDFNNQKKKEKLNDFNFEENVNEKKNFNKTGKNFDDNDFKENEENENSNSKFSKMSKEDRIREEIKDVTFLTEEEIEKLVSQLMKSRTDRRRSLRKEQIDEMAAQIRDKRENQLT